MGDGTAWGGRLACTEKNRWVQFPYLPPYMVLWYNGLLWRTVSPQIGVQFPARSPLINLPKTFSVGRSK